MVQNPGAKCGDRGQVKRALQIGITEGFGHVCPGKLNRPPLPSGNRGVGCEISGQAPDMRYPGGMRDSRPGRMRDSHPGRIR